MNLERKAEIYKEIMDGKLEADDECLVNFGDKIKRKNNDPPKRIHKHRRVLIEDRHGRLKWVKEGSNEHMDRIGIAHRLVQLNPWLKTCVDYEDVDLDKVITTEQANKEEEERKESLNTQQSRIFKSQWEYRKTDDEKAYLEGLSQNTEKKRDEIKTKTIKIIEQIDSITSVLLYNIYRNKMI